MLEGYYRLPISFGEIMQKKDLERCTLQESVFAMIHLICTSNFGECKHEDDFGCELWDHDFENITSGDRFKVSVKDSILEGISRYEKRLANVHVDIDLEQVMSTVHGRRVKNRVTITVTGNLAMTNERIHHSEHFFIGPLSYY